MEPQLADHFFMLRALESAKAAGAAGEVPVGAVIVRYGRVLAEGSNSPIADHDPTAHAEIRAMRAAARAVGNYRLSGCTLFVTLEPCPMCAAAMMHARIARVVFGASDPKTGALGGVVDLRDVGASNHRYTVTGGVLQSECATLLKDFFRTKRAAS